MFYIAYTKTRPHIKDLRHYSLPDDMKLLCLIVTEIFHSENGGEKKSLVLIPLHSRQIIHIYNINIHG